MIRRANRAFLDLIQARRPLAASSASGWTAGCRAQAPTLSVLLSQLQQYGSVRLFGTCLTGDLGAEAEIEISAVLGAGAAADSIAVVIRDVSSRLARAVEATRCSCRCPMSAPRSAAPRCRPWSATPRR